MSTTADRGAAAAPETGLRLRTEIALRWADTDQYAHVNNVAYLRYLEEARIRSFGLPDQPSTFNPDRARPAFADLGPQSFTVTAGQRIEYVRELNYSAQSVTVESWLSRIGRSSLDMDFRITDSTGTVYLLASVALVLCDLASHRPRALTPDEVRQLGRYLGEPVRFR